MSVGMMFLIRWSFQILVYCLYLPALWSNPSSIHMTFLRWYDAFIVKLILEVFGAVGAVWGFSEIVTLRNHETTKIWRPIALAVGVVFLVRWLVHSINFAKSERESAAAKSQVQVDETRPQEVEDLDIADLQLKETISSDALDENTPLELHTSMEVDSETLGERSALPTPTNPSTPLKRQRKQMVDGDTFA